ncbi:MAG: hypothetical protein ACTHNE_08130 [Dyella sp.]|uniref:hypothetical protein n=1 Tax=Dyella sp. TaxID=1869338 RepID=UPI003F7FEB0E
MARRLGCKTQRLELAIMAVLGFAPQPTKTVAQSKSNAAKTLNFCIAPVQNMPIDKYKGLLEELALKAARVFKKEGKIA